MIVIMSLVVLWLVYWLYKADKEIIYWQNEYEALLAEMKHNNDAGEMTDIFEGIKVDDVVLIEEIRGGGCGFVNSITQNTIVICDGIVGYKIWIDKPDIKSITKLVPENKG